MLGYLVSLKSPLYITDLANLGVKVRLQIICSIMVVESISNLGDTTLLRALLSMGELREKGHFFIDSNILGGHVPLVPPGSYVSVFGRL